jgi:hypothetical protein
LPLAFVQVWTSFDHGMNWTEPSIAFGVKPTLAAIQANPEGRT